MESWVKDDSPPGSIYIFSTFSTLVLIHKASLKIGPTFILFHLEKNVYFLEFCKAKLFVEKQNIRMT